RWARGRSGKRVARAPAACSYRGELNRPAAGHARSIVRIIRSDEDIAEAIAHLGTADSRLRPVIELAGELPLRRSGGGFEGLAQIVVGQQLSISAADAIWQRLRRAYPEFTADKLF